MKFEIKNSGNGTYHQCLGQSGHTGDQAVASREQCNENFLNRLLLSDDDAAQFLFYFFAASRNLLDRLPILFVCVLCGISVHVSESLSRR